MNQLALFESEGQRRKEQGLTRAVTTANDLHEGWSERAYTLFLEWIQEMPTGSTFMTEQFRRYVEDSGRLPPPASKRAYGIIPLKAVRNNLIRNAGYDKVQNPKAHQANAAVWQKV